MNKQKENSDVTDLTSSFLNTAKSRSVPKESWEALSDALGITINARNCGDVYEYIKALEDLNRVDLWISNNGDVSSVSDGGTVLTNTPLASYESYKVDIEAKVERYKRYLKIPSAKQDYLRECAKASNSYSILKLTIH